MRIRGLLLCGLLFCVSGAQGQGSASVAISASYAPEKKNLCGNCEKVLALWREAFEIPKQSVILASGGFRSDVGSFLVLDLEARTLTRYLTRISSNPARLAVTSASKVVVADEDFSELLATANEIWNSPEGLPTQLATDITWDIVLVDGDAVRRDFAVGLPDGLGAELEARMKVAQVRVR
jgi:hypothetical protein